MSLILATLGLIETAGGMAMLLAALIVKGGPIDSAWSRMTVGLLISGAILLSVWGHRC